jgi:CubicO group peptidase (beta-lactamase class C family)
VSLPSGVDGFVEPGWEGVAEAFARNFAEHGDIGAAASVFLHDRPVVDLWGGMADAAAGRPWEEDTVVLVFSSTKGATAICANQLVERGRLDVDTAVASYWPEFAAAGKEAIPARWVLSHQAGLPAVTAPLTLQEVLAWDPVVAAIAAQAPMWEPGTATGYHARTFGWMVGEIVRRVAGISLGTYFAREVAEPLGLDFWIGLPADIEPRVARLYPPIPPEDPKVAEAMAAFLGPDTLLGQVLSGPSGLFGYNDMWNDRALHACEMPSSNGIASARSLARMYAATIASVDGVRLLSDDALALACEPQAERTDRVLGRPTRFGLGFMLAPVLAPFAGPASFGHPGAGGSLGFADPSAGLAFGYVMNQMQLGVTGDARTTGMADGPPGLIEAAYRSLA